MVEKDAVRRGYDELAEEYAEQRFQNGYGMEILAEFLDSLSEPDRILDAGCGCGNPVLSRISTSATGVGIDISSEQLRLAKGNVPDAVLSQGDMTQLPFETGTFDAVVAYWSLIHIPMDDHEAVIDEFARVLRPGGRVLVCEGTNEWVGDNPNWLDAGVEMQWNIAGAEKTRHQLRDAGFEVVDSWGVLESLAYDGDDTSNEDDSDVEDEELPWTFFAVRLET